MPAPDQVSRSSHATISSATSEDSESFNTDSKIAVPHGCGLMICLEEGRVRVMTRETDRRYPDIHPNCYAPAKMTNVRLLHGGGSGSAVFYGCHVDLGELVMKHSGVKDAKEVFALAGIGLELQQRSKKNKDNDDASEKMRARIPEFVMLYISPHHVRDRNHELWGSRRSTVMSLAMRQSIQTRGGTTSLAGNNNHHQAQQHGRRRIYISNNTTDPFQIQVKKDHVLLNIPDLQPDGTITDGLRFLQRLEADLSRELENNHWKVTIAQKAIGGPQSENGAQFLLHGKLTGSNLTHMIQDFTAVITSLQNLTHPHEVKGLQQIQKDVETVLQTQQLEHVTAAVDAFCGKALIKNYTPETGRFPHLFEFRELHALEFFVLQPDEEPPARFLARMLDPQTKLSDIFLSSTTTTVPEQCAFFKVQHCWLELLQQATSFSEASAATDRIWTCGLTDAGLHNTFFATDRGLEMFDLGEPHLMPKPAFLTKFLMSFYHILGMEDDDDNTAGGGWICRFEVVPGGGQLRLTQKTQEMIPYLDHAFSAAVDHFVRVLFHGDTTVRDLLVQYSVIQLVSDASFCLLRWEEKGGGEGTAARPLEKWLWRSLWDLYIASHVMERHLAVVATCNNSSDVQR